MRAVCWEGKEKIQVETVPDPAILNPRDAIIKVTTTAICGSDLHIYDGYIPTMEKGDVLGHEFMGEVVEVAKENTRLQVGDRVVVPFTIACGDCHFCNQQLWSLCLPQGRYGVHSRRLRRMARQVSARGPVREGLDAQDGSDPHAQVHAEPARAYRTRRDRPVIHHHAPNRAGRRTAMYRTFRDKDDSCIKVVIKPDAADRPDSSSTTSGPSSPRAH